MLAAAADPERRQQGPGLGPGERAVEAGAGRFGEDLHLATELSGRRRALLEPGPPVADGGQTFDSHLPGQADGINREPRTSVSRQDVPAVQVTMEQVVRLIGSEFSAGRNGGCENAGAGRDSRLRATSRGSSSTQVSAASLSRGTPGGELAVASSRARAPETARAAFARVLRRLRPGPPAGRRALRSATDASPGVGRQGQGCTTMRWSIGTSGSRIEYSSTLARYNRSRASPVTWST